MSKLSNIFFRHPDHPGPMTSTEVSFLYRDTLTNEYFEYQVYMDWAGYLWLYLNSPKKIAMDMFYRDLTHPHYRHFYSDKDNVEFVSYTIESGATN